MKGIMVQGTGSGVGKSLIVMALCRYFSKKGYRVTPFKAQNMALNSYVTKEGAEIGRAQALQALAAGVQPTWAMNPVLLKASGPLGTQVIIRGKPVGTMKPSEYYDFRDRAWEAVLQGWHALEQEFDLAIVEGAGSPAEINLRDVEIVNMAVAREFGLPVVLVGDIDRGGVFASLYGTMALLEQEARFIKAFLINKFRGSIDILEPGLRAIEEKTGVPVIGVVPYVEDLLIEEEDSMGIYPRRTKPQACLRITVLRLPLISNFTDFLPLVLEDDIEVLLSLRAEDILNSDLVIIPGTKSTIQDLEYLRSMGVSQSLKKALDRGVPIMGICGGYQMLGQVLKDPYAVESETRQTRGLGFLDTETVFTPQKTTTQVVALQRSPFWGSVMVEGPLQGYEIHMGSTETNGQDQVFRCTRLATQQEVLDGTARGLVFGTYLHGIFDNDNFRNGIVNFLRQRKGLPERHTGFCFERLRQQSIDRATQAVLEAVDIDFIQALLD